MATYNKFDVFTKHLIDGDHDFNANVFKVMLSAFAPGAANTSKANITEISAVSGYTAGGATTTISTSTAGGIAKVTGSNVSWTSSGTIGPFRYATLYNDSATSPVDPVIAWWDYGTDVTLNNGESLTVGFDQTNGIFTIQ